ncbi:Gfo/Idh/MocA family protein [Crateriforma conspicua]|uniref:Gfo/Idh/MocA family protein n=1 Tax=Crateriforma conspicua TaxID=2527996 RepID=UPI0011895DCE|nr:Gfo/Idh/MocA family oxidoreductase [Crateriforma conspicua]QDV62737.1 putative oxidoreductase YcjS [Crateriforma conspicua]
MHSQSSRRPNRRSALKTMVAAASAPLFVSPRVFGNNAPSNTITLGHIGVGIHGVQRNLNGFLNQSDCRPVVVCDVMKSRAIEAGRLVDEHIDDTCCDVTHDFREVLSRDDVDAVVISTPDHWHVPMSLMALEAGKHTFCEKPTLTIREGQELVAAVKRSGKVFGTGLEDRSVTEYFRIAELVRNGVIGTLQHIEVGLPVKPVFPIEQPAPVPDDLDFNLWIGPAPMRAFTPKLTTAQCWRQIRDFSGGSLTDWGSHLIDTAQVANFSENTTPISITGEGQIPENAINSVPHTFDLDYTYANGVTMHVKSDVPSIRLEGSDGWIGNRGWCGELTASDPKFLEARFDPGLSRIWPQPRIEHRDFLDALKSGDSTMYDAESLHRLSTVMHLGSIAMELNRPLNWDPQAESFDDADANALRSRPRRDWS